MKLEAITELELNAIWFEGECGHRVVCDPKTGGSNSSVEYNRKIIESCDDQGHFEFEGKKRRIEKLVYSNWDKHHNYLSFQFSFEEIKRKFGHIPIKINVKRTDEFFIKSPL